MNELEQLLQKHPELSDYQNNLELQLLLLDNSEDRMLLLASKISENLARLKTEIEELGRLLNVTKTLENN